MSTRRRIKRRHQARARFEPEPGCDMGAPKIAVRFSCPDCGMSVVGESPEVVYCPDCEDPHLITALLAVCKCGSKNVKIERVAHA